MLISPGAISSLPISANNNLNVATQQTTINFMMGELTTALTTALFNPVMCMYAFDPMKTLEYPPNDQYIVIQSNNIEVKSRTWHKNSKVILLWRWYFTLWLFLRLSTDISHQDNDWLNNTTLGSCIIVDNVVNTLQNYVFVGNDNNIGFILKEVLWQNKDRPSTGWGCVRLKYYSDISSRVQTSV